MIAKFYDEYVSYLFASAVVAAGIVELFGPSHRISALNVLITRMCGQCGLSEKHPTYVPFRKDT